MIALLLLANGETNVLINSDGGCVGNTCERGVETTVFSGNSQPAEQENRCGRAREGEGGGHAETAGKMAEYIYPLSCETCTGVFRLTRHVAVTLSNPLVLVGSFLQSLWARSRLQFLF